MDIQQYRGKLDDWDEEGLAEVDREMDEHQVRTDYCLKCPCGTFLRNSPDRNGEVAVFRCPREREHASVHYHPGTGERYRYEPIPPFKHETSCEITHVCVTLHTQVKLRELLAIPRSWILEVEEDSDCRDYLDLDMEMRLLRVPDQHAYDEWEREAQETKRRRQREETIIRLRERLQELTGEEH